MRLARAAAGLVVAGLALALVVAVVGGASYPGYDHVSQYISELGARGAPTGAAVSWLGFLPTGVLLVAGCGLAAVSMRARPLVAVGFVLLAGYGSGYALSAPLPCDFQCGRGASPSAGQMAHELMGVVTYLSGIVGLAVLAVGLARQPTRAVAAVVAVCAVAAFLAFGVMAGAEAVRGLAQRVLEAAVGGSLLLVCIALFKGQIAAVRAT